MPKIDITIVCWRRGKVANRIDCDSGTSGAPAPPCRMRHSTSISRDCAIPQSSVATVKHPTDQSITRLVPKRDTSQPVIGVTTAVARMLNVMAQAISSWVADSAPCICGRIVDVVSSAVPYSDAPRTTVARVRYRCAADIVPAASSASMVAELKVMSLAASMARY